MSHQRKVYVVGRNGDTRKSLTRSVGAVGAEAWPFDSGADFLGILDHLAPACVLLDMDDGDVPGLEIMAQMAARDIGWPVIAVSASEDLTLAIAAMKLGALDFLRHPVGAHSLAPALSPAWATLERVVEAEESRRAAQERLARLTAREMDVLLALLSGQSNKGIAHEFGISVRTVEMHRAHIMAKLAVKSLAEAALLAPQAGLDLGSVATAPPAGRAATLAAAGYGGAAGRDQLAALARRLAS